MELAKAYVQIVPSAKGIKGELSSALGGEASAAGDSAGLSLGKNLVGAIGKVVAAAGIGKMIGDAISAGADYEQLTGGVETLFKGAADTVMQYSAEAYKTAGVSANQYMEIATSSAAAMVSSLGGDVNKAAELTNQAVIDMADNSAKMGTDLASVQQAFAGFAKGNFTLLDNLKLGYGGTKTEMERLLADATALSGVEYDISSYSDIVQAIHVVQTEMGITGTTAKEAASTVSGSMQMMKSSWENLLTAVASGQNVGAAFENLTNSVFTFAQNIVPMLGQVISALPEVLSGAIGTLLRSMNIASLHTDELVQMAVDLVTGLANALITGLPYLVESFFNLLSSLGTSLIEFDWAGTATELVGGLRNDLDLMAGEIFGADAFVLEDIINGIMSGIPQLITTAGNIVTKLLEFLMQNLPKLLEAGVKLVGSLAQGLLQNMPAIITSITQLMAQLLATIVQNLPQMLQKGIELIGKLAAGLIQAIPQAVKAIVDLNDGMVRIFTGFDWLSLGRDIINGIINGLNAAGSALWDAITNIARGAFQSVKNFFGIGSPSKLMRDEIGEMIPAGIAIGIEDNMKPLTTAMHDIADTATTSFNTDVMMTAKTSGAVSGGGTVNYGGVTINVTAQDVQQSRDFVDWLEQQLVMRANNRKAAALA